MGGYEVRYDHNGRLTGPGGESNRLTLGSNPTLQARRRFATAADLLVGFAHSFVFEFTGSDANFASSLANSSLVQPLLRGAGRDVALEQLSFVERALLANLRAYSQYRQDFYTEVAIGEAGVMGYIGLLQELQEIRNTQDSLSLQLRTQSRLEAYLADGLIDLVQVDEYRQNVERERANLLQIANSFELTVDRCKKNTLGLPPDLPVELDDSLIRRFQFVAREATAVQDAILELQDYVGNIADLQDRVDRIDERLDLVGKLPDEADVEGIRQVVTDVFDLVKAVRLPAPAPQWANRAAADRKHLGYKRIQFVTKMQRTPSSGWRTMVGWQRQHAKLIRTQPRSCFESKTSPETLISRARPCGHCAA